MPKYLRGNPDISLQDSIMLNPSRYHQPLDENNRMQDIPRVRFETFGKILREWDGDLVAHHFRHVTICRAKRHQADLADRAASQVGEARDRRGNANTELHHV